MTNKISAVILFIVGTINLLPLIVFFDATKTVALYGIPIEGESLTILMRHRGVLLSLLGLTLIAAAFKPEFRIWAIAAALISKFTFIFLAFTASGYTAEIRQVALIDGGSIILLITVLILHFRRATTTF